jgi:hypothetical protein
VDVFWRPLASPSSSDVLVTRNLLPLAEAIQCIEEQQAAFIKSRDEKPRSVTGT